MIEERGIPLKKRFQQARIVHISSTAIDLELVEQSADRFVRVHVEHFHDECSHSDYKVGEIYSVFLRHTKNDGGRYASLKWGDQANNPWMQSLPALDTSLELVVVRYAGDGLYAVCNPYESEQYGALEILIHKNEIPERYANISECVDIGDVFEAQVLEVNPQILLITASIKQAILSHQHEHRRQYLHTGRNDVFHWISRKEWQRDNRWNGAKAITVAIFLKDPFFAEHLLRWLHAAGFAVLRISSLSQLVAVLNAVDAPSCLILSKRALPTFQKLLDEFRKAVSNSALKLIWLGQEDHQLARQDNHKLAAPFILSELMCMLTNETFERKEVQVRAQHLKDPHMVRQVQKMAEELLKDICQQLALEAAFWLKKNSDQAYEVEATYNLKKDTWVDVVEQLERTQVTDVLIGGEALDFPLDGRNILSKLGRGASASRAYIQPIPYMFGEEVSFVSRVVVFFYSANKKNKLHNSELKPYLWAMQSLVEAYQQARRGDSMVSFYEVGKNASAYLHEVRESASNISGSVMACIQEKEKGRDVAEKDWRVLKSQVDHLSELAAVELGKMNKTQLQRASLKNVIEHTLTIMRHHFSKIGCELVVDIPDLPMMVTIAPMVITQALRNIIDNALFFVKKAPASKRVRISVGLCETPGKKAYSGLRVDVEDNGPGVKAGFVSQMFQPRESTKGRAGTGLGLHYFRGMLRELGGDITLESRVRWKSTKLRIVIPIVLDGE